MDAKAFEEKVLGILEKYHTNYDYAFGIKDEITLLVEPLLELVNAYEELEHLKSIACYASDELYYADKSQLQYKISELKKRIEAYVHS